MPDNPTNEMGDRIQKGLWSPACAAILFFISPVLIIYKDDFFHLSLADKAEFVALLSAIIGGVAYFFVSMFRWLDFHNLIDDAFIKVGPHIGVAIQKKLAEIAHENQISSRKISALKGNLSICMDIFYHFTNQQTEKRELAFAYWERYFIYLGVLFFCVLAIIIFTVISIFIDTPKLAYWLILCPAIIYILFGIRLKSLLKKIEKLPESQLRDILATQKSALIEQIQIRT